MSRATSEADAVNALLARTFRNRDTGQVARVVAVSAGGGLEGGNSFMLFEVSEDGRAGGGHWLVADLAALAKGWREVRPVTRWVAVDEAGT